MSALPPHPAQPLTYRAYDPQTVKDLRHLRLLAIFHYIWGPLMILFSSIFIFHIVLGVLIVSETGPFQAAPATQPAGVAAPPPAPAPPPPVEPMPRSLGWFFIGMGAAVVLFGWTSGILTIVSGRGLAKQKWRMLSLIVAGVNCLFVPIGTVLGVFTLVILLRESVQRLYNPTLGPDVSAQRTAHG